MIHQAEDNSAIETARSPAIWLLMLACAACSQAQDVTGLPNVLLISMDTTRSDHCSLYGYELPTTPNLERLAAQGARFDLAYAPTATTGPTHASIFTGLYSVSHGVVKNGLPLAERFSTLAERLQGEGYETAAILGSFALSHRFGYAQGFSIYDDEFSAGASSYEMEQWEGHAVEGGFDRRADETTRRALRYLEEGRSGRRPFFLFVHYFDPHDPYIPPEEHRARLGLSNRTFGSDLEQTIADYDAEIAYTDHEIGRLLDQLEKAGLADDTIVVVTGDHGEGLMAHGHMEHGAQIYEESVRVPLVIRWPGRVRPATFDSPVELVDLTPTLFGLIGREAGGAPFHGRDISPALRDETRLDADQPVFLHRRHYAGGSVGAMSLKGQKYGVRQGDWKYIFGPEEGVPELFDLKADPGELRNLHSTETATAARLHELLEEWRTRYEIADSVQSIPEKDLEKLRALGYTN